MLQESNSHFLRVRFISELGRFIYDSIASILLIGGVLYFSKLIGLKYCWDCIMKLVMDNLNR
jgi:hypothetical protein